MTDRAIVRDQALQVAQGWSGPDAPASWALTASLFATLAADDALLGLAAQIPADRLPPLLFVASVHHLIVRRRDEELAAYFPVVGRPQPELDDRFAHHYRAFCLAHRDELVAVWDRHVYQMNEVARTTQLALALADVHRRWPDCEVALVDVGTGAGFGLLPDAYAHELGDGPTFGDASSPVRLRCDLRGAWPQHVALPTIVHRIGIDVDPIGVDDADARSWLAACLPPEAEAQARVAGAIDVVRRHRPSVVRGDVIAVLPGLLGDLPDALVCVTDAYTAVFLDDDGRAQWRETIAAFGRTRDVVWISLDPLVPLGTTAGHTVHGFDARPDLVERNRRGGVFAVLSWLAHVDGAATHRLLATAHPSGTRMEWLAS